MRREIDLRMPTSFFRIFRLPDDRWTWALWRSDMTSPLVHGRDFLSREEAVANTVDVQQAASSAGWTTELDSHLERRRSRQTRG